MKEVYWISAFLWLISIEIVNGRGIDVGICDDETVGCPCGNAGNTVFVSVKRCTYFYRWRASCKPCDKLTPDVICANYRHCGECNTVEKKCSRCPPDKFGERCTLDCRCQNGGMCNQDGSCQCRNGYHGHLCETSNGILCQRPEDIANARTEVVSGNLNEIAAGTKLKYTCEGNAILLGNSVIECTSRGTWTFNPPACVSLSQFVESRVREVNRHQL